MSTKNKDRRNKGRQGLSVSNNTRKPLSEHRLFRAMSLVTVFSLSTTTIAIIGSATSANAISMPSFNDFFTTIKMATQADKVSASINVNTAQTASHADYLGKSLMNNANVSSAVAGADNTGRKLADITEDMTLGKGLSEDLSCPISAEKNLQVTKEVLSATTAADKMIISTGSYNESNTTKAATRAEEHLKSFCDISEVRQGLCLPIPDGLGGADSNYGSIANNTNMSPDVERAAYAYMTNVIDPGSTKEDVCDSDACGTMKSDMQAYTAISSIVHSAYINQIADSNVVELAPQSEGKSAAQAIRDANKPLALSSTVASGGGTINTSNTSNTNKQNPSSNSSTVKVEGSATVQKDDANSSVANKK